MAIIKIQPYIIDSTKDFTFNNVTATGSLVSANANLGNTVTANYFVGNGSLLTGLPASYSNANVAAYLPTHTGNVNAAYFVGNGAFLSGLVTGTTYSNSNVSAYLPTYAGTLTAGDTTITGNLTVSGNFEYANVTSFKVKDPIIEQGGNPNGTALASNDGYDRGQLLHYYSSSAVDAFMGWDNSNGEFAFGSNVSVSSEVVTFNTFGNVRAGYFIGNGSQLTGLPASYSNSNVAAYLPTYNGNILASNANVTGTLTVTTITTAGSSGNITGANYINANYYIGNGALLTGIIAGTTYSNSNVAAYLPTYNGNILASNANVTGTLTVSTITTAGASGNITGANYINANYYIGNGALLTGIIAGTTYSNSNVSAYLPTYTGNLTAGNANVTGNVNATYFVGNGAFLTGLVTGSTYSNANVAAYLPSYTGNISANYYTGNGSQLTNINGSNVTGQVANALIAGTVYTAAQPNITSVGTLTSLSVTGNVSANYHIGNGSTLTNITGANVTGQVANALIAGTVYTAAQPNITSVGTLTSLSVTGNVSANYFVGNGSQLTNVNGSNVTGQVANALIAGTVYTNAQPNITSVGTLTSLSVTGLTTTGNVRTTNIQGNDGTVVLQTNYATKAGDLGVVGNITAGTGGAGNVTASYFVGNGSLLSGLTGANVTGQVSNALVAGTVYTNAQPNITSVGTLTSLTVSGDATVTGNLTISGTYQYVNVSTLNIKDPVIEQGGNPNGVALASNDGYDRGQLLHYYTTAPIDAFMGWKNSSGEFIFASNATLSGNVATVNTYGNVHAGYFIGNGSQLTGQIGNALVSGTVYTNAQPNITSVGTLTSLSVTGNVSANYFVGNGSTLTNITGANVNGNVSQAVHAYYADVANSVAGSNVTGQVANALIAGTVYTNAQPNITSVGTLTSLSVTGNVSANYFIGNGSTLTNISGSNVTGQVSNALIAGTVYTNAHPNITSVGTLTSLSVTGNVSAGNVLTDRLLYSNGVAWTMGGGSGTPGGSNTQVQFNDGGSFSGSANLTYNKTNTTLTANNFVASTSANLGSVSNVIITGGTSGQVLTTNGSGVLSWQTVSTSGSTANVTIDSFSGNGVQANFTLSTTPSNAKQTLVNYNGVILLHDSYTLAGNVVSFVQAPAAGSAVEVITIPSTGGGSSVDPAALLSPFLLMGA